MPVAARFGLALALALALALVLLPVLPFVVAVSSKFSNQASFSATVLADMNVVKCHSCLFVFVPACADFSAFVVSVIKCENTDAYLL